MDEGEGGDVLGPLAPALAAAALALARRFSAGATMWCWSPDRPDHAQHVAVEFVHPVIVGKRALPAVAISGGADSLRPLVAAGDVVLVVGANGAAPDVLRRCEAWGAMTIWLGAGPSPLPSPSPSPGGGVRADHLLWLADETGLAAFDGRLVLLYHVLWELTHVCFEHPGLLRESVGCQQDTVCVTCSDEGRMAEVVDLDDRHDTATVRTAAGVEQVDTMLVGELRPGDLLLVHAGTAITVVGEDR